MEVESVTERLEILHNPVDVLTMSEALQRVAAALEAKQPYQVVTANAEILYNAAQSPALGQVLQEAGLITADGMGVLLAARILGKRLPERVSGVELVHALAKRGAREGWSFYLLGAKEEVLDAAARRLQTLYPGLILAGSHHGYFSPKENSHIVADIKASSAQIVLAAMGAPRQDLWLREHLVATGATVGVGVGGTFDILAGTVKRAPLWMQRSGLEWFFRLTQEPGRIGRMLVLPRFVIAVVGQRLRRTY